MEADDVLTEKQLAGPVLTPSGVSAESEAPEQGALGQNLKEACIVEKVPWGRPKMRAWASVTCRDLEESGS